MKFIEFPCNRWQKSTTDNMTHIRVSSKSRKRSSMCVWMLSFWSCVSCLFFVGFIHPSCVIWYECLVIVFIYVVFYAAYMFIYKKPCAQQSINMQNIISFDSVRLIMTGRRLNYNLLFLSLYLSFCSHNARSFGSNKCIFLIEFIVDGFADDRVNSIAFQSLMCIGCWTVTILIVDENLMKIQYYFRMVRFWRNVFV